MSKIIGDYELLERIGAGGMGEVWRAQNVYTHVACAVKLLPSEATADRTFVMRFFDEGRLMQTLDHPRIVRVHHVGHDALSGRHFLVMDFVAGRDNKACSLHDLLEQSPDRRLPAGDVSRWAKQVAEALAYAHGQGVVHRDIKPANVLVDRDSNARVADFGLAKAVGEEWLQSQIHTSIARSMGIAKTIKPQTRADRSMGDEKTGGSDRPSGPRSSADALLGTYDYMAPEQRGDLDAPISPATDVYAFGVMVYRLLTGRRPSGMAKPVSQVVPGLSKEWDALISRCLEHDAKDRYADGSALLEALESVGRVTRGSSKVLKFGSSKVKDSKTWLWLAGAAVIAVVSSLSPWSIWATNAKRAETTQAAAAAAQDMAQREKTEQARLAVKQPLAPPVNVSEGRASARPAVEKEEKQAIGPPDGEPWTSPAAGMEFVWIPSLKIWVGKYEVTNGEYRKKETAHDSKDYNGNSLNGDRQPVVYVNFDDAVAYAAWLTERDKAQLGGLRYRVISDAEWLTCAQCGDGREYPWGNAMPPKYGNYHGSEGAGTWSKIDGYTDGYAVTCPVEKSGKNDWGLYGVGGNVWEMSAADASGSSFGAWRGASWSISDPDLLRCAFRIGGGGSSRDLNFGFRLVVSR